MLMTGLEAGLLSRKSGGLYSYMPEKIGPGKLDEFTSEELDETDALVPFCGLPFIGASSCSKIAGGLNRC